MPLHYYYYHWMEFVNEGNCLRAKSKWRLVIRVQALCILLVCYSLKLFSSSFFSVEHHLQFARICSSKKRESGILPILGASIAPKNKENIYKKLNTERNTDTSVREQISIQSIIHFLQFKLIRFALFFFTFISVVFFSVSVSFRFNSFVSSFGESLLVSLIRSTHIWYVFVFEQKCVDVRYSFVKDINCSLFKFLFVFWLTYYFFFSSIVASNVQAWIAQLLCNNRVHLGMVNALTTTKKKGFQFEPLAHAKRTLSLWLLGKPNHNIPLRVLEFPNSKNEFMKRNGMDSFQQSTIRCIQTFEIQEIIHWMLFKVFSICVYPTFKW